MVNQQYAGESETFVRRYDYEDEWVMAADVGGDHLDVDIVDGTAIVVVDGETEAELDLPGSVERVDTNNGVLEVRGE
ncbi:DUF7127 family protein [Haloplanus salilacus]|uniref:DUF7127 family protein n=1 Tax=Haloplanus salilacus TaxID=2949994 RepID=UPI0030D629FD